jgi:multisubunit Na+/H+ antiporter MnhE subunit
VFSRAGTVVLSWLVTAGVLFAFWLLLIDTIEEAQLWTGLVAAVLGATGSELVRAQGIARVSPRRPALLLRAWRPFVTIPRDLALLCREAALGLLGRRRPSGRLRALPFDPGSGEPPDRARFAAAEMAGSFSPNTFVIGIDPEEHVILVHQLVPDEEHPGKTIDPLGAG